MTQAYGWCFARSRLFSEVGCRWQSSRSVLWSTDSTGMSRSGFQGLSVTLKPLFKRAYARPRMQGCYMDGVILECIIKMGHARERSANFKRSVGDGSGPLSSCDISQSETSHRSRRGGRYYVVRHHRIGEECGWDSSTTCRLRGNLRESGRIIGSCIPGVNRTCSSHRRSRGCR